MTQALSPKGMLTRITHDILAWHKPAQGIVGFDGCSFTSICKYCGKKILQDSQGNWFEASVHEEMRNAPEDYYP